MANVAYSNARAKSFENYLLGEDRINRLIDCTKPEDALKILSEVNFGDGITLTSALDFEQLLSAEKKKLFAFIKEDCASLAFADFILLKNDFHNAEALIKAKHLKIDVEEILEVDGRFDVDKMKEKIFEDDYSEFPVHLKTALEKCDLEFIEEKATGSSIASIFSKGYFAQIKECTKLNPLITEIYNVKADFANVGVALRLRDFSVAKNYFVPFGKITQLELQTLCEEQLEALPDKFKLCYISEFITLAVETTVKGQPLSAFEKKAESYAVERMLKQKYETRGILPFVQYCYYKLADISNVRIIMVGLINGLSKTDIRNRIRSYYER